MSVFHSGFAAIIGRPNAGKSTFMNTILGEKVSIISPKPQTTRNQIRGIYTTDTEQIIFIDTPGIHKPHHQLGEYMNQESLSTLRDADLVLYIVDGTEDFGSGDEFIISQLKKTSPKTILVMNKIDLIRNKERLMENVLKFSQAYEFDEIYYISALTGEHTDTLLAAIAEGLEEGPMYYPKDQKSDYPEPFVISELIREKVLLLTQEEVPHSVAVAVEALETDEKNPQLTNIRAVIFVERPSQKKIIIGAGGAMIKQIGTLARKDIVMILGQKVYLELWVKVEPDWRNRQSRLRMLGYTAEKQ